MYRRNNDGSQAGCNKGRIVNNNSGGKKEALKVYLNLVEYNCWEGRDCPTHSYYLKRQVGQDPLFASTGGIKSRLRIGTRWEVDKDYIMIAQW